MAEPKAMYLSLTIRPATAFTVADLLSGRTHSAQTDVPGLVGFCPVFDSPKAAAEWGNGRWVKVEKTEAAQSPMADGRAD